MSAVVIRGGSVLEGADYASTKADVVVVDGVVTEISAHIDVPSDAIVLDASGCIVGPGLVDLHTHLREPGNEAAETIETGSRAAALGGYTAILAMPNTTPAIDSRGGRGTGPATRSEGRTRRRSRRRCDHDRPGR